ncbi:GNAT family N-acetyltransferase [Heyndrickxia ginsengihumi]|uniref:GNAT family N-acetyltransferase n=1 Tax=Heyndrickxia ginsengihumi TaxID=363870 RepID=A0A0A6VDE4_9BACI|nr:GNAT family N-acetyltransferase [Heyndrickxia ginsengihumi]KHD85508.1 hypothetical protein NG54_09070 [Heyndrickxia ginsengihumi]MCM3024865.1 GNAT family N-acetyltransferase [Heyndrickxia ginsengihumi]NEY20766.1 GNAT family N-acetyltransferase [Heyndrickxia ginsengihumi]
MCICKVSELAKHKISAFFEKHWGSPEMVISSGIYHCNELDGFVYLNENQDIIGLITYVIRNNECEIISLDSIVEGNGIGSKLLQQVENIAKYNGCRLIKLITTNDNLHALKFYQKRGYRLIKVLQHAVDRARKLKPSIPLIGNDGIPLRDELVLQKDFAN